MIPLDVWVKISQVGTGLALGSLGGHAFRDTRYDDLTMLGAVFLLHTAMLAYATFRRGW